jgi:hypothetical protein
MPPQMPDNVAIPRVAGGAQRLAWTAPASWQPGRASSMRMGSFTIPGEGGATADLAITAFPGDVGGDLANINRWRGQIGLQPIAAVDGATTALTVAGLPAQWVLMRGPELATLSAWLRVGEGTWFFKMTGSPSVVEKEQAAFLEFLKTVRLESPAP